MLDDAIDRETHDERKQRLVHELAGLREDLLEQKKSDLSRNNLLKFLELISSLAELHTSLDHDEKRLLLKNCFSNLSVQANEPVFEPYSWLISRDFCELTPMVNHVGPLLELLSKHNISRLDSKVE